MEPPKKQPAMSARRICGIAGESPILPKVAAKGEKHGNAAKFNIDQQQLFNFNVLSSSAQMMWVALMGMLPKTTVDDLVKQARKINKQEPSCSGEEAAELAAV